MSAIKAFELLVEPFESSHKIGMDESEWRDDPVSIAKWIAIVEKIEPLVWADGELEEYERYRQASRAFNIEAVRNQMGNPGDVKLSLQVFSSRGFRACKVRSYSPGRSTRSERRPG